VLFFGHFHDQSKLFPRAVELRIAELLQGMRIERNVFADAAIFDDKVQPLAVDTPGRDAVH
jgi:hypothetical protein